MYTVHFTVAQFVGDFYFLLFLFVYLVLILDFMRGFEPDAS